MRDLRAESTSDGWGSQLISVSDLMAALLFVFILMLMAFVLQLQVATQKQKEVVERHQETPKIREQMLVRIRDALDVRGIRVEIDSDHGVLRMDEQLLFPSGMFTLTTEGERVLAHLADVFGEILPCFAESSAIRLGVDCDPKTIGLLEAVFIEGHTDSVQVPSGRLAKDNWDLSAKRSIATFQLLRAERADVTALRNRNGAPLFSVSGYADQRPIGHDYGTNSTEAGRRSNRRIDFRFLMVPPEKRPDPPVQIEEQLKHGSQ